MRLWNKAVPVGERCTLELPLNYTKHDHDVLDKIFRVANNMKNNLISWYDHQLTEMTRTRAWRDNQKSLSNLYSEYADDVEALEKVKKRIARNKEAAKKKKKASRLSCKNEKQLNYLQTRVKEFEKKRKVLYELRNEMIRRYGFSKFDFEKRINKYRKSYETLVGIDVAQKIAYSVWDMFQAVLYGKGITFAAKDRKA